MNTEFDNYFKNLVYEPIDLCACYEPIFEPPAEQVEEWRRLREEPQGPFSGTVKHKIGNTWYIVETECDGKEPLTGKVRRLLFSDREVI